MPTSERPKRSKPRKESGLHGKRYERKIFALTALKCLLDPNIQDFWLLSNPSDIKKFDDIILSTTYKNKNQEIFFIQIKHRSDGTKRPVVADKLDNDKEKDLSLKMYEEAFLEIKENKEFFETQCISEQTDLNFILFNNCKVTTEKDNISTQNANISFHSDCDCFPFIDTSENGNILKIINKTGKYDETFIDRFYFYTEQLNEESVDLEICNLLKVNEETVHNLIYFIYSWVEPKQDQDCIKLTKFDLKMRLLDTLFADLREPPWNSNGVSEHKLIKMINKFNATIISEENSSIVIWNEILRKFQHYCGDPLLKVSSWEELLPSKLVEEKFPHFKDIGTLLVNNKGVTMKFVFLYLVLERKIPFFITTNNVLFESFKNKLLHALNIYCLVYNVRKECIHFPDTIRVFQNLNDLDHRLYLRYSKKLIMSFQGKSDIDLYSFIKNNDETLREKISVDDYIKLLHKKCTIGEPHKIPKYYVNRNIQIPVVKKEVLNEMRLNYAIFQHPQTTKIKSSSSLRIGNFIVNVIQYMYLDFQTIITTPEKFDKKYSNFIQHFLGVRDYYLFKYLNEDYLVLLYANGPVEDIRPFITYVEKEDMEIYNFNENYPINIICNNAGMGKSTFLTFLNSKLSADEWVIHIDLKKICDHIKTIKTTDDLIDFSYNCQREQINESFRNLFENIYANVKHKVLWLIDDYEEVNQPVLLNLFKSASLQGFRIWIVARPLLKSEFENIFGVFSMELGKFGRKEQDIFIEKYLQEKNKRQDEIKIIMAAIENIRHLLEDSFIGTCQQTMMLTEIFSNYEKSWKEREWRVQDIYEKFMNLKIGDNYGVKKDWYLRTISKLALKVFFTDEALKTVFDLEEFEEDVGIFKNDYPKDFFISEFTKEDLPIFSHKTYAEFLAARWLLHTVKKQMSENTPFNVSSIFRMLHLKELTTVRRFFDNMITKDVPSLCTIVNREESNDIETIDRYFHENDLIGRSVLHLSASYGHYFDVGVSEETASLVRNLDVHSQLVQEDSFVLLKPTSIDSTPQQFNNSKTNMELYFQRQNFINRLIYVSKEDALFKFSPIDYALMSGSLLELDVLLNIRNLATEKKLLKLPSDEMKYCLLYHSIRNNLDNIFASLDVKGLTHIKIDPWKGSFLHLAVASKNFKAVTALMEHHSFEDWGVDKQGNTPLHIACNQKDDSMLECFSNLIHDVDATFINRKNLKGKSYLHFFVRWGHITWIQACVRIPEVSIDSEDFNGNTPFLSSVIFDKIGIATLLRCHGAKVDHANNKKMTALHYAALKGFFKCAQKLLEWESEVDAQDNLGETPLMKACRKNFLAFPAWKRVMKIKIIELLLKYKANGKIENKIGETPLIIACNNAFVLAVKTLLRHKVTYGAEEALKISINKKHNKCIDLLLQAGISL